MVVNILLVILIIIRILTGVRLVLTGLKNKLPNLIWLAVSMLLTVIVLLFSAIPGNPLGSLPVSPWVFTLGSLLGIAALIIFNQQTFYKDRTSALVWVWMVFILCCLMSIYGLSVSTSTYQSPWGVSYILLAAFVWAWHGWLAGQALNKVASEPSVHDWVKTRYQLIVTYSIVLIIGSFTSSIRFLFSAGTELSALGSLTAVISLITQITSVTLLFLVWAMPEAFRLWLNRNYQKRQEDQVYEQALSIMDMLGSSMAQGTKLPKTLAIVGIRKTIAREIKTEDSKAIEAHVIKLGYDDWSEFLNNPELTIFIREVANASPSDALRNARHTLIENQSLFTLQAK